MKNQKEIGIILVLFGMLIIPFIGVYIIKDFLSGLFFSVTIGMLLVIIGLILITTEDTLEKKNE